MKIAAKTMRIDLIPGISDVPLVKAPLQMVARVRSRDRMLPGNSVIAHAYRDFFQSIYDAGFITDPAGKVEDVNWRAIDFFDYSPEAFCQLSIPDLISGADQELIETLNRDLESERFTLIQAFCKRQDGSFFPAEIAVSRIKIPTYHLCFFVRDITLRRDAEEMLRTEHQAIQNAAESIAVTDSEGRLEYVNPATLKLWRYTGNDAMIDQPFASLMRDPEAGQSIIEAVMQTRRDWRGEVEARRSDQTVFSVEIRAVCNVNTDGTPIGLVLSMTDLTERRLAEHVRQESERQRVMLESLGTACHHLGQPATVLFGSVEMLSARLKSAEPAIRDLLDASLEACRAMTKIMARLRQVHEYRPMPYLPEDDDTDLPTSKILEI